MPCKNGALLLLAIVIDAIAGAPVFECASLLHRRLGLFGTLESAMHAAQSSQQGGMF